MSSHQEGGWEPGAPGYPTNRPSATMPPTLDAVRRQLRRYVEGPQKAIDGAPMPKAGETLAAYRARLGVLRSLVLELEGHYAYVDADGRLDEQDCPTCFSGHGPPRTLTNLRYGCLDTYHNGGKPWGTTDSESTEDDD